VDALALLNGIQARNFLLGKCLGTHNLFDGDRVFLGCVLAVEAVVTKDRKHTSLSFVGAHQHYFPLSSAAWAAARRAIGTRNGLQET
jgi:hypothetical protein